MIVVIGLGLCIWYCVGVSIHDYAAESSVQLPGT